MEDMLKYVIIIWIITSVLTWGVTLGYFSHKFPQYNNINIAIVMSIMSICGPFGLIISMIVAVIDDKTFPPYFMLKPYTKAERWEFYKQEYPSLAVIESIDTFEKTWKWNNNWLKR